MNLVCHRSRAVAPLTAALMCSLLVYPLPSLASDSEPLTLDCDGQGAWTALGSVSSGIPGDVVHDHDVSVRSGGQARVRLHFGPDGSSVTFPATFPRSVSGRAIALKDVEWAPDRIVAKARGLLGSATVLTMDRHSGDVNVTLGNVTFSGACRKVSDAPEARKF